MPSRSKIVFFAVVICLLLSLAGGSRRLHGSGRGNHVGRDRHRMVVRLRRLRTNASAHCPVCPSPAASIPPDEDDDDERFRLVREETRESTFVRPEEPLIAHWASWLSACPSAPDQPLYRTLCTLLI